MFVIANKTSGEFWSNHFGWTDLNSASTFTETETFRLNLPIDGVWITVKNAKRYRRMVQS